MVRPRAGHDLHDRVRGGQSALDRRGRSLHARLPRLRRRQRARLFRAAEPARRGRDPNTPAWVQHLAFEVENEAALLAAKAHVEAQAIDVLGPTWHGIFKSIYFFDPNGHRLELACNIGTDEQYAELRRVAPLMLEEWSRTKRAPRHAEWLHKEPGAPWLSLSR